MVCDPAAHHQQLKRQTELLVKEVGLSEARALTGRSSATLRRYYSRTQAAMRYFMPMDEVMLLEKAASRPFVSHFLSELHQKDRDKSEGTPVNSEMLRLAAQFGTLMRDYSVAMRDATLDESERAQLERGSADLQEVLNALRKSLRALHQPDR